MTGPFSRIGVVGKPADPKVISTVRALVEYLTGRGLDVTAELHTNSLMGGGSFHAVPLERLGEHCELVIVVGGDGTLLGAARALAPSGISLLGINLGRLGFLVDISADAMLEALDRILDGEFDAEHRFLLSAGLGNAGSVMSNSLALNDVVLHKWNTSRVIEFETYIDGRFVNTQRSDGLIVSTPTGSTAYALSGGGPLLHPSLDALVLVPICPHTLSNRPIVVNGSSFIEVRISRDDHQHVRVSCDGQVDREIRAGENLYISKSEHPVRLLHPKGHNYFKILRAKLGWGGHPPI